MGNNTNHKRLVQFIFMILNFINLFCSIALLIMGINFVMKYHPPLEVHKMIPLTLLPFVNYIFWRGLLYKVIHICGYYALPKLRTFRYGYSRSISIPVFVPMNSAYRQVYDSRSKGHQFCYYCIRYFSLYLICFLSFLASGFASRYLPQNLHILAFIFFVIGVLVLGFLADAFEQWWIQKSKLKIILWEHAVPILAKDNQYADKINSF